MTSSGARGGGPAHGVRRPANVRGGGLLTGRGHRAREPARQRAHREHRHRGSGERGYF
jgi:hypothetical protein